MYTEFLLIKSQITTTEVCIRCIAFSLHFISCLLILSRGDYFLYCVYFLFMFLCSLYVFFDVKHFVHVISFVVKHFELHFLCEMCYIIVFILE